MRYGIFGDIHGNLEAFEAVLEDLRRQGIDRLFSLGDIVGYGPDPNSCVDVIRKLSIPSVSGNHDWASVGRSDLDYFNPRAKEAILWTKKVLTEENKAYLKRLPLIIEGNNFQLVHGSLKKPADWFYILNFQEAENVFALMEKPLLFAGHSHVPIVFCKTEGKISCISDSRLNLKEEAKYIINAGSVGQPRDGDSRSSYVIFDEGKREIIYKRVKYPIAKVQRKIRKAGLPEIEAARLSAGR